MIVVPVSATSLTLEINTGDKLDTMITSRFRKQEALARNNLQRV